jgi:adenylate cyclase
MIGALWTGFTAWVFLDSMVLPLIEPLVAMALSSMVLLSYRFMIVEKDRRYLRKEFSSYVSPNLVEAIIDSPDHTAVDARHQDCSFIFTDMANFTAMVESLDPELLRKVISDYIDGMVGIVFKHGGTLDKIVGDALCIFFSAPISQSDHAQRAVDCAVELDRWARGYVSRMSASGIVIGKTRIGVNSGEVVVGNFGGSALFDYTAYGDAVNTAARLESVNKYLGTNICVSRQTVDRCEIFVGRPIGQLVLKGKSTSTEAYEPLSQTQLQSPATKAYLDAYELMAAYDRNAGSVFAQAAIDYPEDPLMTFHHERLKEGEFGDIIVMSEK